MKRKLLLSLILGGMAPTSQGSFQETLCQLQSYTHAFTPRIIWTAKHCSSIDVLTALKYGDDPKQENWCHETALHWAAFYSQSVSIEHLLSYDADPNHIDITGKTPLHWAFLPETQKPKSHNKVVSRLLKAKSNPNTRDHSGKTPLHYGVVWPATLGPLQKNNAYDLIEDSALALLLSYGANPNTQDEDGNTPLHLVLKEADTIEYALPVVQLLIEKNADPLIGNRDHETPWDIALGRIPEEEARILLKIEDD